jgi:hypothetical protein
MLTSPKVGLRAAIHALSIFAIDEQLLINLSDELHRRTIGFSGQMGSSLAGI